MSLTIYKIEENSLASQKGLQANDVILSINEHPINDFIDFQYYTATDKLNFKIKRNNNILDITINQNWTQSLGISPQEHKCRTCANNCIFCFVDQIKPGLRKTLNIKDDDYLFSFIYGNFITLTNLAQRDFDRIIKQNLSPLYVSVHTTNPILHKKMLRYKHDFNIQKSLSFLSENGIELHTQIVLVPGWNDGIELKNSLNDLINKFDVESVGIVPVGLTKYRNNLLNLSTISKDQAKDVIKIANKFYDPDFNRVFCSDEIFLKAHQTVPEEQYYGDFAQLENGIGMLRLMLTNWNENKKLFFDFLKSRDEMFNFITGVSASKYITSIVSEINSHFGFQKAKLSIINNKFFGESITVAGLLTAQDIFEQIKYEENTIVSLPGNFLNYDDVTLDQVSKNTIIQHFKKVMIINEEFENWELFE